MRERQLKVFCAGSRFRRDPLRQMTSFAWRRSLIRSRIDQLIAGCVDAKCRRAVAIGHSSVA